MSTPRRTRNAPAPAPVTSSVPASTPARDDRPSFFELIATLASRADDYTLRPESRRDLERALCDFAAFSRNCDVRSVATLTSDLYVAMCNALGPRTEEIEREADTDHNAAVNVAAFVRQHGELLIALADACDAARVRVEPQCPWAKRAPGQTSKRTAKGA